MRGRPLIVLAIVVVGAALTWLLLLMVPRWRADRPSGTAAAPAGSAPAAAERKINATLYYVSGDGMSLLGVQREVPFGEPIVEQARRIVEAQLAPAPSGFASAIPAGTSLRGVFVTERDCGAEPASCKRDAFVDLSGDARTRHTGGALDELFTIYTIVNAVTVNLPTIERVQILVDGKEVDTLAGHVDLRRPLEKSLKWITSQKDGQ